MGRVHRLNVTLDGEYAAKLSTRPTPMRVTSPSCSTASTAPSSAQLGLEQARAGRTLPLDEL